MRQAGWIGALMALIVVVGSGCSTVKRVGKKVGMRVLHETPPPAPRTLENLSYVTGPEADETKHRLDLFLPAADGVPFPMLVFVHGGGFAKGDKDLVVGGVEVYGDLGRYYASRGIGVAVISYRLQPDVDWPAQVDDVARAARWVEGEAPALGAGETLLLAGHSAGAWLAGRVALDPAIRRAHGLAPDAIDGVIAVSGAGYAMEDEKTWSMDADIVDSERIFRLGSGDVGWRRNASLAPLAHRAAPPFLLLHTRDEWRSLARQNNLLHQALVAAGGRSTLIEVRGGSHARMVLRLSEPDRVSAAVEAFVHDRARQVAAAR